MVRRSVILYIHAIRKVDTDISMETKKHTFSFCFGI